jgi:hypothetical protein
MIWRSTPDRIKSFNAALEFWSLIGDVHFFDSGHTPFNRAASRNLAVREAERLGHWKLAITDADCIPTASAVKEAFATVDDSAVHLPYRSCRVLNDQGNPILELDFTCGGTYITTVNAWNTIGGQDERFTKWAPEDFAFSMAHRTLLGEMTRHDGVLLSLAHQRDPDRAEQDGDPIVDLFRQYEKAFGDVEAMRALCFPSS